MVAIGPHFFLFFLATFFYTGNVLRMRPTALWAISNNCNLGSATTSGWRYRSSLRPCLARTTSPQTDLWHTKRAPSASSSSSSEGHNNGQQNWARVVVVVVSAQLPSKETRLAVVVAGGGFSGLAAAGIAPAAAAARVGGFNDGK